MRIDPCAFCGAYIDIASDHLTGCTRNEVVGETVGVDLADMTATGNTYVRLQLLADGTIRWAPIYDQFPGGTE